MRRIKYFVASSLDSYISRKDGGVDEAIPERVATGFLSREVA
jgi:hypothetical protein